MLNTPEEQPNHVFFTTGSKSMFKTIAEQWLGLTNITVDTVKL